MLDLDKKRQIHKYSQQKDPATPELPGLLRYQLQMLRVQQYLYYLVMFPLKKNQQIILLCKDRCRICCRIFGSFSIYPCFFAHARCKRCLTKLERSTLIYNRVVRTWTWTGRYVDISTSDCIRCPSRIFYLFDSFNHFSMSFGLRSNCATRKVRSDWCCKTRRYKSRCKQQNGSYVSHLNTLNSTVLCAVPVEPGPPAVIVGTPVGDNVPAREPLSPPN